MESDFASLPCMGEEGRRGNAIKCVEQTPLTPTIHLLLSVLVLLVEERMDIGFTFLFLIPLSLTSEKK